MIHSTFHHSGRRTTSLSLIAFERSIETGLESPAHGCKLQLQRRTKTNVRGRLHAMSRRSTVSEHLATSSVIPPRSPLVSHRNFRKERPFGRSSSLHVMLSVPSSIARSRDPVNVGEDERMIVCGSRWSSSLPNDRPRPDKVKSSRRGNKQTKLRICVQDRKRKYTRRDLKE